MGLLEPDGRYCLRNGQARLSVAGFKTLDDLPDELTGKKVLVRVDLNVPMDGAKVTDDTRLRAMLPTVLELSDRGAIVLLLSHFGRPKGEVRPDMSTAQLVLPIHRLTGRSVRFIEDCQGPEAERAVTTMLPGNIGVLENTRFHVGEEKNDPDLARGMAALGDIYVDDSFSTAHRAHASTEGVARLLPNAAGRSMQAELTHLKRALGNPERPLMAVVGGAKVSTKIELLQNLVKRVETLVIGGAMANTFLAAEGIPVGKSLFEADHLETARQVIHMANEAGAVILLPRDLVVAKEFKAGAAHRTVPATGIGADEMALDVGPDSIKAFENRLLTTRTLVWNGPFGAFETQPFDRGTVEAAKTVASRTRAGQLLSVAGGGDTVAALAHAGVEGDFTYVSTAGGAFLEWLEGKSLPGVEALGTK